MMAGEKGIESLQVWQQAIAFVKRVYKDVLPHLPKEEKWAMASQLRRAAQSVPANIAEGYGRFYYQEGVRFFYIARGSTEECFTYLSLAKELGYIPAEEFDKLRGEILELQRLINGYISYLKRSKRGENEPGSQNQAREAPLDNAVLRELGAHNDGVPDS